MKTRIMEVERVSSQIQGIFEDGASRIGEYTKTDIEYKEKEDSCVCSKIRSLSNWVHSSPVFWAGDHQEIWRGN